MRFAWHCSTLVYYFCKLCGIKNDIAVTVNEYSEVFSWGTVLPEDFDEFKQGTENYFALLFDAENFAGWGNAVADFLEVALKVLLLVLPCIFVLILLVKGSTSVGTQSTGKDTVPAQSIQVAGSADVSALKADGVGVQGISA